MKKQEKIYPGLYDQLQTDRLFKAIEETGLTPLTEGVSPERLAERLAERVAQQILPALLKAGDGEGNNGVLSAVDVANRLVDKAYELTSRHEPGDWVSDPPRVLKALYRGENPPVLPETGLAQPWLFTAGKDSPSLLRELQAELGDCDHVDILVSFITKAGVRKMIDTLRSITSQNASGIAKTSIRVITTTYTGATDQDALDMLAELPGCQVRVSLDGTRTRLHAKAWIFRRRNGFGAAYVGSANLSGAALLGGLEWTVKFCEKTQLNLYNRAKAHFESLWNDSEFSLYDPSDEIHRSALAGALKNQSGYGMIANQLFFDIQPRAFQEELLEQIHNERAHGRCRNLLISATGTGKTVMAAFDYQRIAMLEGGRPRLLFVAHRSQILMQSLRTYRQILRDSNFGDLLDGNHQPQQYEHVFATIQSLQSRQLLEKYGTDYWRVVVVDECHHIEAKSFETFVSSIQPKYLLGLTATPERSDGKNILRHFDARPDGRPSAELRLWHALDLELLAPFEYYACDDETDFRDIPWNQSSEIAALDKLLTGNDVRARAVIQSWRQLVTSPTHCKTLVFCVSLNHAAFMEEVLNRAGIISKTVSGGSTQQERQDIPRQLEEGKIHAIVTVDLYNEGVDLPFVDTLLLLRPTQSVTLFQQQIGRGLRRAHGKDACLILDFVGQHQREFRFDRLLGSITGLTKTELVDAVDVGFGKLPSGCHIQLQKQARETILENLKTILKQNWKRLQSELNHYVVQTSNRNPQLADFLNDTGLELDDIYRSATGSSTRSGWTSLRRDAGLLAGEPASEEAYFSRRFEALKHIDDSDHLQLIQRAAEGRGQYVYANTKERSRGQMLTYQIDSQHKQLGSPEAFVARLAESDDICDELIQLVQVLDARTNHSFSALPGLENTPLKLHAAYELREIKVAVGLDTEHQKTPITSGVFPLIERSMELLFVTLDKAEALHEGVAYNDYAISRDLFHWQSQNSAGPGTNSGRRYLESPENGWSFQLFVRENKSSAYRACGPLELVNSHGEKPMNITWKLQSPLTAELYRRYSVLRGA